MFSQTDVGAVMVHDGSALTVTVIEALPVQPFESVTVYVRGYEPAGALLENIGLTILVADR